MGKSEPENTEPQKKKRGRPTKAEAAARALERAQSGEPDLSGLNKEKLAEIRDRAEAEKKELFIQGMASSGTIGEACKKAGISRRTAYLWREDDPHFSDLWDDAYEDYIDQIESKGMERASTKSDLLLMFFLKAKRPHIYRETVRPHDSDSTQDTADTEERGQVEIILRSPPESISVPEQPS